MCLKSQIITVIITFTTADRRRQGHFLPLRGGLSGVMAILLNLLN
ncbi:hypothetical protein ETAE_2936 [Edwardsiella piscicida]|uniref:Uncharacterized protein n=1 Tax=Edwardsiella piscicida TaxID=1263550 RepID=A0AAU8PSS1_EDWPI|nr:hypothetical protein ETAE_2936 [Edwardsiella tarda EIB202]